MRLLPVLAAAMAVGIAQASAGPLAGTSWQLISVQSMDDAHGNTKVADPSHFTLEFGSDGRAALRLDCNRGSGDYSVTPTGDGSSGALSFGPLATTRALCPPPHLDERIARDMLHIVSYSLKDGKLFLSLSADGGIYEWAPQQAASSSAYNEHVVKSVQFGKGASSAVIRDRIIGSQYIDFQVRAGAGQRMMVDLKGNNLANSFNLLPPDSTDVAMVAGKDLGNRFGGLLPDDGVYTIRVFLYRAAADRNEASDFTLSIGVEGAPLKPSPSKTDAVLPGTRYHARATTQCEPLNSKVHECEVYVVRRGSDGTATVELRWDANGIRRILFVKGKPTAADTSQTITSTRNERGWRVSFGGDEHFEIPEPLVFGG